MDIILASHNPHKVEEVLAIIDHPKIIIRSLRDVGYEDEIIEDGATLPDNAWIKADTIFDYFRKDVMADDTGLEVTALGGVPGVDSAHYAGPQRSADDNMDKLLTALQDAEDRSARFRTVVAMYLEGEKYEFEGIVEGDILHERQGTGGFGYDPIFRPKGYTYSFGELSADVKNQISHRAQAFKKVADFLREFIDQKKG